MRRDMDVVRNIILAVSDSLGPVKSVDGVSDQDFVFHAQLLDEAGLVEAAILSNGKRPASDALIWRLTWDGHEFADSVRDPVIWAKTKKGAEAVGGFTLTLLGDLAKGFIKKQIEEHTGVKF